MMIEYRLFLCPLRAEAFLLTWTGLGWHTIATLPSERWARTILEWNITGPHKSGRPTYTWETVLPKYCAWRGFDNWIVETAAYDHWRQLKMDLILLMLHNGWSKHSICFNASIGWQPVGETSTDMECWRWQARTIFWFMGRPCHKILQMAEYWGVAGCSPGQRSLAAVPAGFYHIYAFVIYLLGLTPCALNGLPYHGIQVQNQKLTLRLEPYDCFIIFLPTWFWDGRKRNWKPETHKP